MRYDNDDAALCLSNLLAVGFQRFEIDLYWDEGRQVWSFCPAAVPDASSRKKTSPLPTSTLAHSSDASVTSKSIFQGSTSIISNLIARQIPSSGNASSGVPSPSFSSSSVPAGASLGQALPSYSSLPDNPSNPLISIGQ